MIDEKSFNSGYLEGHKDATLEIAKRLEDTEMQWCKGIAKDLRDECVTGSKPVSQEDANDT